MNLKNKSVLMLLQSEFPPDIRVEKEMKALSSSGIHVFLLSNNRNNLPNREEFPYGTILRIKNYKWFNKNLNRKKNIPIPINPFWIFSFIKILFQERIDCIHVHDLPFALFGIWGKLLFRKKFILDLHENYPAALALWGRKGTLIQQLFRNPRLAEIYEKIALRFADAAIVVAPEHRTYLKKKYAKVPPIKIVGNTVEWGTYDHFSLNKKILQKYRNFFVLSFLGQFSPERDLEVAIQSIKFLIQDIPNLKLLLIGDGVSRSAIEQYIERERVSNYVEIVGWVPFEETASYLSASHICIIPQGSNALIDNGTPHKLFQYMAMGKPVVVSNAKAMKHVVEESKCGEVFLSKSPKDFARAVLKIKSNPDFPYGQNGIQAVQKKYNWNRDAQTLIALYEK